MAALLGVAVLSVPAVGAYAKPRSPVDNGVRCAYFDPATGEWSFYLPFDIIQVKGSDGKVHELVCDATGNWILGTRTALPSGGLPAIQPIGNAPLG
jgi:hypothetical protein